MGLFSKPPAARRPDASPPVKLLVADHEKAERLFEEIESAESPSQRQTLVAQLDAELTRHTRIEERVLYPFARRAVQDGPGLIDEAEHEHAEAKAVLARVAALDVSTGEFTDLLTQLKKLVSHHVDEEESKLFPKLEQSAGPDDLERLRLELQSARFEESPSPQLPADVSRPAPTRPATTRKRTTTPPAKARKTTRPARGRKSSNNNGAVWVQPHHGDDSRWQVRRESATRASRVFDKQADAEKFGRDLARREKVEFVVAGRDGAIRKKQSYGNDPADVRG
jgi:hemerythrin superfamily protein